MKDKAYVEAMQNLRRSSATSPVPSKKKYKRRVRSAKVDYRTQ